MMAVMTMSRRAPISTENHMNQPGTIEVFQTLDYNGSFAQRRILLWKAHGIGLDGVRRCLHPEIPHGFVQFHHALVCAVREHKYTDWMLLNLGRVEAYDTAPKY